MKNARARPSSKTRSRTQGKHNSKRLENYKSQIGAFRSADLSEQVVTWTEDSAVEGRKEMSGELLGKIYSAIEHES